ncbi:MAG: response regulator [Chloroflexota bacterium]|nr:response regulator [Chloroflexota bacterium]
MAKVLVVDDDPGIVSLLRRIIAKRGYQVFTAGDGKEALALAQEHHPDLIFTDIKMPDLGGEELTQLLRADPELYNVPIVILSGTAFLVDLKVTQANAILNKPFELRTVYALLEHFLPMGELPLNGTVTTKDFSPPIVDQAEFV